MTPTEMELRVARALYEVEGGPGQTPWESDTLKSYRENVMYKKARAAIQAMREPTPEMVEAADLKSGVFCNGLYVSKASDYETPHKFIWQAMINAASPTSNGDK